MEPHVPSHAFILPVPLSSSSSSPPSYCEHLVAKALGIPTLVEVDIPSSFDADDHDDDERRGSLSSDALFSCNLCFEVAADPVATPCGHLFCWPCLFRTVRRVGGCCTGPCFVCGSEVDIGADGNVVPIYGRGAEGGQREAAGPVPTRPRARRMAKRGQVAWPELLRRTDGVGVELRRRGRRLEEDEDVAFEVEGLIEESMVAVIGEERRRLLEGAGREGVDGRWRRRLL